jgi:hypothetical protein
MAARVSGGRSAWGAEEKAMHFGEVAELVAAGDLAAAAAYVRDVVANT